MDSFLNAGNMGNRAEYSSDGSILFNGVDVQSFIIPDTVKEIDEWAFEGCKSLKDVYIPDSVTRIGESAFANCESLGIVRIPASVQVIEEYAFEGCISAQFEVDEGNEHFSSENGALYDKKGEVLISGYSLVHDHVCVIPDHVKKIGLSAFDSCVHLEEIHFPDSVTEIGACAFQHCHSLREIRLPDSMVEIGSFAFICCSRLQYVYIPKSVAEIGLGAFDSCTSVSFDLNEDNEYFSSENGALFDKDKTTLLVGYPLVHGGVCKIPESVTSIGYGAFDSCTSLEEVRIPASVTKIYDRAFEDCGFVYFKVNPVNKYYYSTKYGDLCKCRCRGSPVDLSSQVSTSCVCR